MNAPNDRWTKKTCGICGFGEHLAIHRPIVSGERVGEPYGHHFEPYMAAEYPEGGSTFARAAWRLNDYARMLGQTCINEAEDLIRDAQALERRLLQLDTGWQAKQAAGTSANAAAIIVGMLREWRLPGSVWFDTRAKRWRVSGANYQPRDGEVCVGIYAPDVDERALAEDLAAVEARPLVALIGEVPTP